MRAPSQRAPRSCCAPGAAALGWNRDLAAWPPVEGVSPWRRPRYSSGWRSSVSRLLRSELPLGGKPVVHGVATRTSALEVELVCSSRDLVTVPVRRGGVTRQLRRPCLSRLGMFPGLSVRLRSFGECTRSLACISFACVGHVLRVAKCVPEERPRVLRNRRRKTMGFNTARAGHVGDGRKPSQSCTDDRRRRDLGWSEQCRPALAHGASRSARHQRGTSGKIPEGVPWHRDPDRL